MFRHCRKRPQRFHEAGLGARRCTVIRCLLLQPLHRRRSRHSTRSVVHLPKPGKTVEKGIGLMPLSAAMIASSHSWPPKQA